MNQQEYMNSYIPAMTSQDQFLDLWISAKNHCDLEQESRLYEFSMLTEDKYEIFFKEITKPLLDKLFGGQS